MAQDFERLFSLLQPGANVYVAGSCAEPHGLLDAIETRSGQFRGLHYIQQPLGAVNQRDLSALTPDSTQRTFFMTPFLEEGVRAGRVRFIPMHMRAIYDHLAGSQIDVALFQAARDARGKLRFGPNVDYLDAVLLAADHVVIEENTAYIAPQGSPLVDEERVDEIVKVDTQKPLYPVTVVDGADDVSLRLGSLIASVINDGDCLQTGIGAVPAAILANLGSRNDLGFHGGLMDEGVMRLIADGNITGAHKSRDAGKHVLGMALGSDALLDWLATDELAQNVVFRSANYTHEVSVIQELNNFVSINAAIEVDLMGQVNAEVVAGRQISGTGGSVDFMRAAKASRAGRSIIAMSSTARRGTVSRIVPRVEVVTALRTDVDTVVTEYGIAELKDASLDERAEQLIEIAHPDFRDQLRDQLRA